jgi:hypothetical protein
MTDDDVDMISACALAVKMSSAKVALDGQGTSVASECGLTACIVSSSVVAD